MSQDAPSLFELFKMEVEEHCRAMTDGLLAIERSGLAKEGAEALMRAAHSVKGAARVLGFDSVVAFAHQVEEVFDRYRKGKETVRRARVDQLLRAADLLAKAAQGSEADARAWGERTAAEVNALLTELSAPAPDDPPATAPEPPPSAPIPSPTSPAPPAAPAITTAPASKAASLVSGGTASVDASTPKAAESGATGSTDSRVVRVGAEHLDRMMRLAGESVVEARRAPAMRRDVTELKERLLRLRRVVQNAVIAATDRGPAFAQASANPALSPDAGSSSLAPTSGGTALARVTSGTTLVASSAPARGAAEVDHADRLRAVAALVDEVHAIVRKHGESLDELFRRGEEAATALYHEVLASRMRPFSEVTGGFPRMIRDLARQLGKEVEFEVIGAATPVDRDILSKLEAPLTHMLRNAVDHGVELPAERRAAGKRATARIELEARHQAGALVVDVRDDGRGIDPGAVRRRAIERGLIGADMADSLSRSETFDFLFLPGFSTASAVTEVSGRGVGLDVVHRMVQAASGSVSVRSEPGTGTVMTLRLPITLSVIRAALVEIVGESYAVPLAKLERILRVPSERIQTTEGRIQFDLDGRAVGLLRAERILRLADVSGGVDETGEESSVLLLEHDHLNYGVIVDRFLGEQDLVVRPLDPRLGRVPHVAAAALLDDGSVTIILDVDDLLASVRRTLGEGLARELGATEAPAADVRRRRRVLVVDDSITVREVQRQLLHRLGYEVETAVDGADGWNQLRAGAFDLLITDVDMPRMNGIELVRVVRADPRFASLPIAIVSYKDREEDRQAGLEAGANAYLTKGSFRDESFARTVERLAGAAHE